MFKKAERKQAKLRLALAGPSGSGKTYSALLLAQGLGGRIAVLDTEHGSASLYADLVDFDAMELHAPYSPERYIEVIAAAEQAGYETLVIDSYSHEWTGSGGCLEINESVAHQKFRGNTWAAWNETTPRHRKLTDKILTSSMHIICTMRSKTETVQGEGKKILKLGMKSEQRDGTDYEFTVVLDLTHDGHTATASKDRTKLFDQPELISADTGVRLLTWLNSGLNPEERAKELLVDALADIASAKDIPSLQSAFNAAKAIAVGFDDLVQQVVSAKDKRKNELSSQRQSA
ncbi:ATP-binding protein [Pseudomonas extremaustralis]|uniref:AAA domain-containing protein n=1 Tax=Pseudomonas extremaustralis TaxID=359110 RepID=A0A5C5QB42_9PSED|nr:ATP-binding protein [Pseudomonas extremaustralis]EZI23139.1 ATPase AAA [Pseudomonas extremaustralis 14-3 substr. 14-3b]TWS02849.1 ATP-binding protein [Pseudomonas extremaustralis]SDE69365.1 AAA domain-containing protein [Pseudomonas extremaustralis]